MIEVMRVRRDELHEVERLYSQCGYSGGVSPADIVFIARIAGRTAGAVRLCNEHGVIVLRGMQALEDFQRQGIGSALLDACIPYLNERTAFCLPYDHLVRFYNRAGFVVASAAGMPEFLNARLASYLEDGLKVLGMKREPQIAAPAASIHEEQKRRE